MYIILVKGFGENCVKLLKQARQKTKFVQKSREFFRRFHFAIRFEISFCFVDSYGM